MKSKLVQSIEDNGIDLPDDIYKKFGHSILEVLNSESEIDDELSELINTLNDLGGEYSGMACFRFDLIKGLCEKILLKGPSRVKVEQILFAAEEGRRLLSLGRDLRFTAEAMANQIHTEEITDERVHKAYEELKDKLTSIQDSCNDKLKVNGYLSMNEVDEEINRAFGLDRFRTD